MAPDGAESSDPPVPQEPGATDALARWRQLASEILEGLPPEDALAAALAAGFGSELDPARYREIRARSVDGAATTRLFIGAGRRDGADRKAVVEFVKDLAGIPDRLVGGVEVYDAFSFVTVPFDRAERVLAEARKSAGGPTVKLAFPKEGERPRRTARTPGSDGAEPRRSSRKGFSPPDRTRGRRTNSRSGSQIEFRPDYAGVAVLDLYEAFEHAPLRLRQGSDEAAIVLGRLLFRRKGAAQGFGLSPASLPLGLPEGRRPPAPRPGLSGSRGAGRCPAP
jgi:hypothetical protein